MEEGGRIRPEHDKPLSSRTWPIEATSMTQHAVAVDRAQAAAAVVNEMIERRGSRPSIERSRVKEARSINPSLKYVDHVEARKAALAGAA
jgi:hypothetical protein